MGFGGTPEKALTGPMQKLLDGGFFQSVRLIVDRLGFAADPQIRTSQEIAVATAADRLADGGDRTGPGGRHGASTGTPSWATTVVVRITVNWLMGEENLDPAWSFGPAGERYEMEVQRQPRHLRHGEGLATREVEEGLLEQPGRRRDRRPLRQRDPGDVRRRAGHQGLLRPAADHRPSRPAPKPLTSHYHRLHGRPHCRRAVPGDPDLARRSTRQDTAHPAAQPVPALVWADPADQGGARPGW